MTAECQEFKPIASQLRVQSLDHYAIEPHYTVFRKKTTSIFFYISEENDWIYTKFSGYVLRGIKYSIYTVLLYRVFFC